LGRTAVATLAAILALGWSGCSDDDHGRSNTPFEMGVSAAEMSRTTATTWTRLDRPGVVHGEVASDRRFRRIVASREIHATAANNGTVSWRVAGLRPGERYFYRFMALGQTSPVGRFVTAPPLNSTAPIRFGLVGDAHSGRHMASSPTDGQSAAHAAHLAVYGLLADEHNDFNINLGDTNAEIGIAGKVPALTLGQKWGTYRTNLRSEPMRSFRSAAGAYNQWDDWEFINDFSRPEYGDEIYAAGRAAFLDYMPASYTARRGLYRRFRWGRNLELFFLDERSFRDASAASNRRCIDPRTGLPLPAPTLPPPARTLLSALIPDTAAKSPKACIRQIRDPARSLLGRSQFRRFTRDLARSTATFKVVINEVPIQQYYLYPYDRWEGYEAERRRLVRFIRARVPNVVFLTTDIHATLVNDVRLETLEEERPISGGFLEVVTGPAAGDTFASALDRAAGRPGASEFFRASLLRLPPPYGVGVKCAVLNAFAYAEVEVLPRQLKVTLNDERGKPLRQPGVAGPNGASCGPFVLSAEDRRPKAHQQ
jgi:alkaline phosphatase D